MQTYQLLDTTTPPSAVVAASLKPTIKAWGAYTGPFASPNGWSPELVRQYLKKGLGVLIAYVGQQSGPGLGSGTFTATQGQRDGTEAVAWARQCGLHEHTHIALDVEQATTENVPHDALKVYVKAWCEEVAKTHYPGVYAPVAWISNVEGTKCAFIWVPGGPDYDNGAGPDNSLDAQLIPGIEHLFPNQRFWQYRGDAIWKGINADFSVGKVHLFGMEDKKPTPHPKPHRPKHKEHHPFSVKHFLNHHALSTGLYGFPATGFYPGPLGTEFTGIVDAAGHEDIQVGHGTPFYLPAGSWVCTQNYLGDGWGLTLAFRPQFGGRHEIVFMHMAEINPDLAVGQVRRGGHYLGKSGGVPGVDPGVTSVHSGGAHLHLAYSFDVKQAILKEYHKKAFTPGISVWQYGQPEHIGGRTFNRGHTALA